MVVLAIELAKAKSLFSWYQTSDNTHEMRTIVSSPVAFHVALLQRQMDRVVIGQTDQFVCGPNAPAVSVPDDGSQRSDQQDRLRQAPQAAAGDRLGDAAE